MSRLLGPPASGMRRARLGLLLLAALCVAWLVGPLRPGLLPGHPTLVPGPDQSHVHTVLVATWWAAAANAVLCALLLATSGFWARELPPAAPANPARASRGRAFWLLVAGAAVVSAGLRAPLARGSLWWDEAWSVRHVIVGKLEPRPDDPSRLAFHPASWRATFWYYHAPTNHAAYSVAARVANDAWRRLSGAAPDAFDELALRLPALGAAVASVVWVGLLVAELGFPAAAPASAWLLAIHPAHVRYGAEGRGYSFVVLFTLAGAWFLLRALRDGRWRSWLAFAGSQLLLLWTFPLAVHVPLALGGAGAAALLLSRRQTASARALGLARLAVAGVLAFMIFLDLMGPNLAQALTFRKEWRDVDQLGLPWLRTLYVFLATGLPVRSSDAAYPSLASAAAVHPWLKALVFGVLPALLAFGLARGLRRGGAPERAVWLGLVVPVPLFLLHRELQPFFVLTRFGLFGIAAVVPLLAVGLEGALRALPLRGRRQSVAVGAGLALGLGGFATLTAPELRVLLSHPPTPSRELVALLERAGQGVPGGVLRAGVGLGGDVPRVYDPWIIEIRTPEELDALTARAQREGRPLYVFYSYERVNERRSPALLERIRDTSRFEPVARLDGIAPELVIRVLRWTGP
jgi:hypothetical protein